MDEYISREEVVKKIKSCISTADDAWKSGYNTAAAEIMEYIKHIPVADVHPVKQWYSVEENQPDSVGDDVLVVDSYGKYHIAYYLSGSENWMNQDTREPIKDVVKWRYLDGDSE